MPSWQNGKARSIFKEINRKMSPYHQINMSESLFVREFNPSDTEMFIWHRDKKDRIVKIISSKGWMLQIDNEIPIIFFMLVRYHN